jgi:hypothetical protein
MVGCVAGALVATGAGLLVGATVVVVGVAQPPMSMMAINTRTKPVLSGLFNSIPPSANVFSGCHCFFVA